jgi:hypothetical protein
MTTSEEETQLESPGLSLIPTGGSAGGRPGLTVAAIGGANEGAGEASVSEAKAPNNHELLIYARDQNGWRSRPADSLRTRVVMA